MNSPGAFLFSSDEPKHTNTHFEHHGREKN